MADPVTSGIKKLEIGEGKDKKEIFTGTKITPTTDKDGNKTYKVEIVQYDNGNGTGGRVIGEKDGNNINWNENANDDITENPKAIKTINTNSKQQAKNLEKNTDLVTNSADSRAFHEANGSPNEGTEAENEKKDPRLSNVNQAAEEVNGKAGESATNTRDSGFGSYVFPKTLRQKPVDGKGQDYLKFDMLKYEPRGFDDENFAMKDRSATNTRTIGTVILPVPGGIQDSTAVTWGSQTMTPLDMALANVALTTVSEGLSEGVTEAGNQAKKIAGGFGNNRDALAAVIAGMASGGQQLLTRTTGAISNPNMELLFGGPNLRTFSFQYLLAPRNDKEAETVIQILRFFKQGMAPIRTKSRLFMKSPHTFQLSYRNSGGQQHQYLNKFKECALQSFGVNYTPNGNYSTYEDGVMTAYQMTMTYSELNPIYNDDYGKKSVNGKLPVEIGF